MIDVVAMKKVKTSKEGKIIQSVNFDDYVLKKLKEKAKQEGSTLSKLVNFLCRRAVMSDIEYLNNMRKYHFFKMQNYQFQLDEAEKAVRRGI